MKKIVLIGSLTAVAIMALVFFAPSVKAIKICRVTSIELPSGQVIVRNEPQFSGLLNALRHGAPFEATIGCKNLPPIFLPPLPVDVEFQ